MLDKQPAHLQSRRPRVLFVCKGSATDGLGHLTRTRAVAEAAARLTDVRVIAIGGAPARMLLGGSGIDHAVVANEQNALADAGRLGADVVVFDMLSLEESVFRSLSQGVRSVSLSPIFDRLQQVDVVFHRTAIPDASWSLTSGTPEFRMGLQYAVIGRHCERTPTPEYERIVRRDNLSVAVSMGGADAANKTLDVIRALGAYDRKLLLWVMLGEGYGHSYQELVDCAREAKHEIILAKTNESMWHILGTCAVAVLAGGTTTYEAAYAGLPSLNVLERGDRRFLLQELAECGACRILGDDARASLDSLPSSIANLDKDRGALLAMHRASAGLVDDSGAERIARGIVGMGA